MYALAKPSFRSDFGGFLRNHSRMETSPTARPCSGHTHRSSNCSLKHSRDLLHKTIPKPKTPKIMPNLKLTPENVNKNSLEKKSAPGGDSQVNKYSLSKRSITSGGQNRLSEYKAETKLGKV